MNPASSEEHKAKGVDLEVERKRLECVRLEAEIAGLKRSLFQTPGFYSAIAPVVLAALGIVFTWSSGWFDVQRTRISNEKLVLEAQTEKLRRERLELDQQASAIGAQVRQLDQELLLARDRERSMTNRIAGLESEKNALQNAKEAIQSDLQRISESSETGKRFAELYDATRVQLERLSAELADAQNDIRRKDAELEFRVDVIRKALHLSLDSELLLWAKITPAQRADFLERLNRFRDQAYLVFPYVELKQLLLQRTEEDYVREAEQGSAKSNKGSQ
jgi:hypothetical protein